MQHAGTLYQDAGKRCTTIGRMGGAAKRRPPFSSAASCAARSAASSVRATDRWNDDFPTVCVPAHSTNEELSRAKKIYSAILADSGGRGTPSAYKFAQEVCDDRRRTRNLARGERDHRAKATEDKE